MVIVQLKGGLGNQLFQYAAGRRLSIMLDVTLKLDKDTYYVNQIRRDTQRVYELGNLNIVEDFATPQEIKRLCGGTGRPLRKIKQVFGLASMKTYVQEKDFSFNSDILNLRGDCYLDGYWQSEKYFKDIEDIIRNDFTVKSFPSEENNKIINALMKGNSVSIHFRLTDYLTNPHARKTHGVCSLEYYKKAITLMKQNVNNPQFFVFSDDLEWVKNNIDIGPEVTYVAINDSVHGYEDLRLMSYSKHNIIANSSFSWWGAWLNSYPEKIVVAPKQWFKDSLIDASDLIPETWVQL